MTLRRIVRSTRGSKGLGFWRWLAPNKQLIWLQNIHADCDDESRLTTKLDSILKRAGGGVGVGVVGGGSPISSLYGCETYMRTKERIKYFVYDYTNRQVIILYIL